MNLNWLKSLILLLTGISEFARGVVTPTTMTTILPEDFSGFMGETYYKPLSNLGGSPTPTITFPNFVSGMDANLGVAYGAISNQWAQDNIIETCFFQRIGATTDELTSIGTCVIRMDFATGTYLFKRFNVKYTGTSTTDKPVFSWDNTKDNTLTFLPNKQYYFLPTDNRDFGTSDIPNYFVVICTEYVGADTTVYLAKVSPLTYTVVWNHLTVNPFVLTGQQWLVQKNARVITHHRKRYNFILNTLDTSTPYYTQPPNNPVFSWRHFFGDTTELANLVTMNCIDISGHQTDYIFDMMTEGDYLYLLVLGKDASHLNDVGLCTVYAQINSGPIYIVSVAANPLKVSYTYLGKYSPVTPNPFWHFAHVTGGGATPTKLYMVVSHKYDPTRDLEGQYTEFNVWTSTGLTANTNGYKIARPEGSTDMRVSTFGRYNQIMNIKHYVNGKLTFLDVYNFYNLPAASPGSLTNNKLWRVSVSECDDAFSGVSDAQDFKTMIGNNFVAVNCLKNNILITSVYSSEPAYTTLLRFPTTVTNLSKNLESMSPQTGLNVAKGFNFQTLNLLPMADYFSYMPAMTVTNTLSVTENSYKDLPFYRENLIGANMKISMISPLVPGILLLSNKEHIIKYTRSDTIGSVTADSDQVSFNSLGGVYEDDNRRVGVMTCSEFGNYTNNTFDRACSQVAQYTPSPMANVVGMFDYSKSGCQVILIMLQDKGATKKTFLLFDVQLNTLTNFGNLDGLDNYVMTCSGTDNAIVVGWSTNSATPPTVILFSVNNKAIIPAPTGFPSYGLENSLYIQAGGITRQGNNKVALNLAYYFSNQKITSVKSLRFNDSVILFNFYAPTDYYFWQPWYTTSYKFCFMPKSFAVYDPTFVDKTVRVFNGEFYGATKRYYAQVLFDLTQMGPVDQKSFFCHGLTQVDSFSVFGDRTSTNPGDGFTYTNSILGTFEVTDTPQPQKVYNLYTAQKKFISLRANDDGMASIYFDMREFTSTAMYYRVQFVRNQLLAYFNLPAGTYNLKLNVNNTRLSQNFAIKIKVTKQQSIVVNQSKDIDYVAGATLPLLNMSNLNATIANLVTGPIFSIVLLPPQGVYSSNSVLASNRIMLNSVVTPANRGATPVVASAVRGQPFPSGQVFYVASDKAFYIYLSGTLIGKCLITNSDVSSFRVAYFNRTAVLQRVYMVFAAPEKLYSIFFNVYTGACQSGEVPLSYNVLGTGPASDVMILQGTNTFYAVVPVIKGTPTNYDIRLIIFRPNDLIEYYSSLYMATEPNPKTFTYASGETYPAIVPANTPFSNVGGYIDCTVVTTPANYTTQVTLAICLAVSTAGGPTDQILVNNLHPEANVATARVFALVDVTTLQDTIAISCLFVAQQQLSCAADTGDGGFVTFTIDQITDPDPNMFAFSINNAKVTVPAVPTVSLGVFQGDGYTIAAGKKKQGSYVLDGVIFIVYTPNATDNAQYAGEDMGSYPVSSQLSFGFFCGNKTRFHVFDGKTIQLRLYDLAETRVTFTPVDRAQVQGVLRFTNPLLGTPPVDIDLISIFKIVVYVPPPPPPEPTPLWKIYWWVPLVVIALCIAAYFVRIEWRKIQERIAIAKLKEETVLKNLEEFHY